MKQKKEKKCEEPKLGVFVKREPEEEILIKIKNLKVFECKEQNNRFKSLIESIFRKKIKEKTIKIETFNEKEFNLFIDSYLEIGKLVTSQRLSNQSYNDIIEILKNSKYSKEIELKLQKILNDSSIDVKYFLNAFNILLNRDDFNIKEICDFFNNLEENSYFKIYEKLFENTLDYEALTCLEKLNDIFKNKNYSIKINLLIFEIINNVFDLEIDRCLSKLENILDNKNYSEEIIPSIIEILRKISGDGILNCLSKLEDILNNENYSNEIITLVDKVLKKSDRIDIYSVLNNINEVLNNKNLKDNKNFKETISLIDGLIDNVFLGDEDVCIIVFSDILKELDKILNNKNYSKQIKLIIDKLIINTSKNDTFLCLNRLNNILNNSRYSKEIDQILLSIVENTSLKETQYFLSAFESLLYNKNTKIEKIIDFFNKDSQNSYYTIYKKASIEKSELEKDEYLRNLNELFKNISYLIIKETSKGSEYN